MLDIRLIRKNRVAIEAALRKKDPTIELTTISELDEQIRAQKTRLEKLKAERNVYSQKIGEMKRRGEDSTQLLSEVGRWTEEIHLLERLDRELEEKLTQLLAVLPNIPMDDIRNSQDPKDNEKIKEFGQKPNFSFPFKNHLELNERLHLFDFKRAAKLSGTGWPLYIGWGARLEWALLQYMMSVHIKKGFIQCIPPLLVKQEMLYGSGQLPKFENQQFKISDPDYHLYFIPTAEIPLNALHYDEIIPADEMPLRYCAYTPCFRREAGAAGSQERGLIRTHQFNKVEMFAFTRPEESEQMFAQFMSSAEEILQGLELHYRAMLLVTGDMSFAAAKTVDMEVWLPGQNRYYEVSSISNCTNYQSRRSNIRYRDENGKLEFVHTLNGSGLATSRLMVCILENNQMEDGSVKIPKVLQPYLDGLTLLTPSAA